MRFTRKALRVRRAPTRRARPRARRRARTRRRLGDRRRRPRSRSTTTERRADVHSKEGSAQRACRHRRRGVTRSCADSDGEWADDRPADQRGLDLHVVARRAEDRVQQPRSRVSSGARGSGWTSCVQPHIFSLDETFLGTTHLIRADLYRGQPCGSDGAYIFIGLIGYFRCDHF